MSIITATKTTAFAKLAAVSRGPLRWLKVCSASVLGSTFEVRGLVSGQRVTVQADERGLGHVRLTVGDSTRTPTRLELQDLEVALALASKAANFDPPAGVTEVRIAIAEALNGPAPMASFEVTSARDTGRWLHLSGGFSGAPKDTADVAFDTATQRLLVLYQVNASSARQRPMTASELRGLVLALPSGRSNLGGTAVANRILQAARRALVVS